MFLKNNKVVWHYSILAFFLKVNW